MIYAYTAVTGVPVVGEIGLPLLDHHPPLVFAPYRVLDADGGAV